MTTKPLRQEEIAAILAIYYACNGSIRAHQPIERIKVKFVKALRPEAKKILEQTAKRPERYILKHKNKTETYAITLNGIKLLEDLGIIPRKR